MDWRQRRQRRLRTCEPVQAPTFELRLWKSLSRWTYHCLGLYLQGNVCRAVRRQDSYESAMVRMVGTWSTYLLGGTVSEFIEALDGGGHKNVFGGLVSGTLVSQCQSIQTSVWQNRKAQQRSAWIHNRKPPGNVSPNATKKRQWQQRWVLGMAEPHGPFGAERTPELTETSVFQPESESFVKLWKLCLMMEKLRCDSYIPEFLKPDSYSLYIDVYRALQYLKDLLYFFFHFNSNKNLKWYWYLFMFSFYIWSTES